MARNPEGWRIRLAKDSDIYEVYFRHNGKRYFRSCRTTDQEQAAVVAPRIYADIVQREPKQQRVNRRGDSPPLEDLVGSWLEQDSTIAPRTLKVWIVYARRWCRRWESLVHVTDVTCTEYRNERLRSVIADTVRKELGALRRFLAWCSENGHLSREVVVPTVPKKATGTRFATRRRKSAPEISPAEIEGVLASLPEWSTSRKPDPKTGKVIRFAVRARFVVSYETGLRQSLLDDLSAPDHYSKGATSIRIVQEVDKNRYERAVPLTKRAREALDSVCPDIGLIFGAHRYEAHIRRAGLSALPKAAAAIFTQTHLRSARATHVLEATGNVPGAMFLFGWTQVNTASKYTKASQRAAADVVSALDALPTERRRPKGPRKRIGGERSV